MTMDMKHEELENAALKDPLCYGITYIRLPQKRKWEVTSRPWIIEMYQVVNPYYIEKDPVGRPRIMVVIKSTQCGLSTMGLVHLFHFSDFWPTSTFYMLPRQLDVLDFVGTRIDPIIKSSPRLGKLLGVPDSTHAKSIGNSFIYFHEASVEPRMVAADAIMADEIDLCDQANVAAAKNRLDASDWKLEYYFSTPTIPNYGVHAIYEHSDMRRWVIRCPTCNTDQVLDWNENMRVLGPANNPRKVFYGCKACDREIDHETIRQGRWIAEKPERSHEMPGFHISQMMYFPAAELFHIFRDPKTKMRDFYRLRLGMPYELGKGSLERDDILINCFDEPVAPEEMHDGKSTYYMGLDQGNELQILIAKKIPGQDRPRIVHIELIPFEEGFNRVGKLIRLFKIRRMVGDADPNRHSMADLRKNFPGRVILADYAEQRPRLKKVRDKKKVIESVNIHRTQAFDDLFEDITDGKWLLPGYLPDIPDDVELLIDHVTALRRDIEVRRTTSGQKEVGVYRSIRPDNLAHAWSYLNIAIELGEKKKMRIEEITPMEEEPDTEEELYGLNDNTVAGVIFYLAECPTEQLENYFSHLRDENFEIPFPLSYKLNKAREEYDLETIQKVIMIMIERARGVK